MRAMNRFSTAWRRFRGWPGWLQVAALAMLVVVVIAAAASNPKSTEDAAAPATTRPHTPTSEAQSKATSTTVPPTTTTTAPPTTTTREPPPPPQTLQGRGNSSTPRFLARGGLTIVRASHRGESNFIVRLLTPSGQNLGGSLFNVIGAFDGATAVGLPFGDYLLEVEADGPWTFVIEQPRPDAAPPLPVSYAGRGMSVVGPFQGNGGGARFALTHSGAENFIVRTITVAGDESSTIANEIGPYQGDTVEGLDVVVYYLVVEADGQWTAQVTRL